MINNKLFTGNNLNINNNKEDLIKEKLTEYSNDLKSQLEKNKKLIKEKYEIKLKKKNGRFSKYFKFRKIKKSQEIK